MTTIKSNIKTIALERGFPNRQQFSLHAQLARPTIDRVWEGDLSGIWLKTLVQLASALDCSIEDLYTVETNGAASN